MTDKERRPTSRWQSATRDGEDGPIMSIRAFIDGPTGPKTTHFWGPVANWGFVLAVRATRETRATRARRATETTRDDDGWMMDEG